VAAAERQAVDAVSTTVADFESVLDELGRYRAAELIEEVERSVTETVDEMGFFARFGFDGQPIVDALVPLVGAEYVEFREVAIASLAEDLEDKIGEAVKILTEVTRVGVPSMDTPAESSESWIAEVAATAVGGAIGGAAAVLSAPLALALGAVVLVFTYKSKADCIRSVVREVRPIINSLFTGRGYTVPSDGTFLPAATEWLRKEAARMETELIRRVENEGQDAKIQIRKRLAELKDGVENDRIAVGDMVDGPFVRDFLMGHIA